MNLNYTDCRDANQFTKLFPTQLAQATQELTKSDLWIQARWYMPLIQH